MERRWWSELEDAHGIRRDDRSSWRQIPGDLKAAKRDPIQARILTGQVRGVFDDLLGTAAWSPPRDWGRAIVTFPEPGAWEVPARLWHWDNLCEPHIDQPRALFVISFIGPVAPRSGGTPDPFRVAPSADPAGTPDSREPAGRLGRRHLGTVPPLPPLAHGAHGTSAVTRRPDRRFHGRGDSRRRSSPPCSRIDGRAGRHGRLPSRHGPLPRPEPRPHAALHADQAAASHPSRSQAANRIAASAPQHPLAAQIRATREPNCRGSGRARPRCRFSSFLSPSTPLTWATGWASHRFVRGFAQVQVTGWGETGHSSGHEPCSYASGRRPGYAASPPAIRGDAAGTIVLLGNMGSHLLATKGLVSCHGSHA